MSKDIKKNFLYSGFLTTANYIFPLLTFPYVTRILGVNGIGICDFIDSIIKYFILFSSLGIGIVGIREIASQKDNKDALSDTFSGLFSFIAISSAISIIILAIITFTVPKLYEYRELMLLGGFKIIFNFLLIEWFYKGLEDFKYITFRTLIVKTVYVISVFLFVRTSSDFPTYYLLTVLMVALNACINSVHVRKHVNINLKIPNRSIVISLFIYGAYSVLTSFYTTFNVAYLGFTTNTVEVGYYATATRLFNIFIAIFSAFTGVMLPRMSSLIKDNNINEFKNLYHKSIDLLCSITIPGCFYTIAMAPIIIKVIAGAGYEGAIIPMRLVMPLLFIIGYEQILVIQALMPLKKDKTVLINSLCGAIIGIIGNLIIVKKFGASGSAIVWLSCEVFILILSQIAIKQNLGEKFPFSLITKNIIIYSPIFFLIYIQRISVNYISSIILTGIMTLIYIILVNIFIFPNSILFSQVKRIITRIYH